MSRRLSVLLLCDDSRAHANTVRDHIGMFLAHSKHEVRPFNPIGLPRSRMLNLDEFDAVVIHYSLVVISDHFLPPAFREQIRRYRGLKVQFIQDEYRWVNAVTAMMRTLGIHVLFTLLPEREIGKVYNERTLPGVAIYRTMAGYMPENLTGVETPPFESRPIDIGYRGRTLPFWLGELAQEKVWIGRGVLARAIYGPLLERQGKRRWVEKSPQNVYAFQAFLDAYPQGRVVYLVRDARDVVCSLMRKGWGGFKRTLAFWLVDTALCETFRDHPRAHRVRYEDLVRNPRDTVGKLLDFLGVSPDVDRVLNFHAVSARAAAPDASSAGQPTWHHAPTRPIGDRAIGAWQGVLSEEQLACVHAATIVRPLAGQRPVVGESGGQLLERLGYEPVRTARVDAGALHRLILEEKLFLSGTDYAPRGQSGTVSQESHEAYVECDPGRLPKADFSWDDKRLLAKFGQVREEFLALWAANRERQAEIRAICEELGHLRAVPLIRLFYRMHQLPYGEWPRALARKLRTMVGGGAP